MSVKFLLVDIILITRINHNLISHVGKHANHVSLQ